MYWFDTCRLFLCSSAESNMLHWYQIYLQRPSVDTSNITHDTSADIKNIKICPFIYIYMENWVIYHVCACVGIKSLSMSLFNDKIPGLLCGLSGLLSAPLSDCSEQPTVLVTHTVVTIIHHFIKSFTTSGKIIIFLRSPADRPKLGLLGINYSQVCRGLGSLRGGGWFTASLCASLRSTRALSLATSRSALLCPILSSAKHSGKGQPMTHY